ncbi:MAG TPA: hypothetical protein VH678_00695 [Xanthobacteraceae bacterium]|jgi:hypothetical protein
MRRSENQCANCGGKFGLVSHQHWGLRFCRKACRHAFLVRTAKDHARMRKWFGLLGRGLHPMKSCSIAP